MKVVIAIDSFKGSMTSWEAGNATKEGVLKACPDAEVIVSPIADGGEGTVDSLVTGLGGEFRSVEVTGPLGEKVCATYGIVSKTAIIEMASAAGITLVPDEKRNPLYTTTYGVGELILDAINLGCRSFLIGIGGSATNDGGAGMLQALGFDLLDESSSPISFGAAGLKELSKISLHNINPALKECNFRIACDVTNPLCGERGCSAVFGPQKGATPSMIKDMDQWLHKYATLAEDTLCKPDFEYSLAPGAGAAGGLGFAFKAFLNATLEPGIDIVLDEICFREIIKDADLVITGEGRIDAQTAMGKAPTGVASLVKDSSPATKVIAFCGAAMEDACAVNEHGIDAFFPIVRGPVSLEEAMKKENAMKNIFSTAYQVMRMVCL